MHHLVERYARVVLHRVEILVRLIVVKNVWIRVVILVEIARILVRIDAKMHVPRVWVRAMESVVIIAERHVGKTVPVLVIAV